MIPRLRFNSSNNNSTGSASTVPSNSIFSAMSLVGVGSNSNNNSNNNNSSSNNNNTTTTNSNSNSNDVVSDPTVTPTGNFGNMENGGIDAEGINDGDLPAGWRIVSSRHSGRDYYLHVATGHTQWDRPTEADAKRLDGTGAVNKNTNLPNMSMFSSGVSRMGAGLSSMFSQANTRLQTTLQNNSVTRTFNPRSSSAEGKVVDEIFENERLDGKPLQAINGNDPKRFSDRKALKGSGSDVIPDVELPKGYQWISEWEVDHSYTAVDKDGWTYGADFADIARLLQEELSHASKHPTDAVRRRRWIRVRQNMEEATGATGAPLARGSDDTVDGSPAATTANTASNAATTNALGNSAIVFRSSGGDTNVNVEPDPATDSPRHVFESDGIHDDPFLRTTQRQQGVGFRVNMKFPHRGGKDNTKDYQSINLAEVMWLVNAQDITAAPTDEIMREQTANLEERIKDATSKSMQLERTLRMQHEKKAREISSQQSQLDTLIADYKKLKLENETLQSSVQAYREKVDALRKEATEKDLLANEEQRALNAEVAAANQALEEKAKALATARMRYKRDNKSLVESIEDAKQRLEQQTQSRNNAKTNDPVAKELESDIEKLKQLHAKLEAVRQHRLAMEEESKALFNLVVEKKADLKFKSKKRMEAALKEVEDKISTLKEEQAALTKKFADKPEGEELRQLTARRNDIRSELGALKERRTMLVTQKRKQEGAN